MTDAVAHKLLIRGGSVIDGTGVPGYPADVLIVDGRIETVVPPGSQDLGHGHEVLDADGLVISPGFIDPHSHADESPLQSADDTSKILQGITTEVVGNCGTSPDPSSEGGFGGYFDRLDKAGYVTNYCPLVGHGTLRRLAMGMRQGRPERGEARQMATLLEEALEAGAWGLSSGLVYAPGVFSDADEMVELVRRLPDRAVYATHMRDEGRHLQRSVAEALDVARRSGARLQVSHLKAAGIPFWGGTGRALKQIREARNAGLVVNQDVYPYDASSTTLLACLPPWFLAGDDDAVLRRLGDSGAVQQARNQVEDFEDDTWENIIAGDGYERIFIASTVSHAYEGRSLAEIAAELGVHPFDVVVRVLVAERLRVTMVDFSMDEADMLRVLMDSHTSVCTDGLTPSAGGKPHPRLHGSFPRVLGHYVRDRALVGLEPAIHKMTGLTANVFGMHDRGVIAPGLVADLVIFDPASIADQATYTEPDLAPTGIRAVLLAGATVVSDGKWLGVRRGARLAPAAT